MRPRVSGSHQAVLTENTKCVIKYANALSKRGILRCSCRGCLRVTCIATDLGGGQTYALSNPFALDGRVSTHPGRARGWAPMQSYLILEKDAALLVDTGFSVHADALVAALRDRLAPGVVLSVLSLRIGDYSANANVRPLAEQLQVGDYYGTFAESVSWGDVLPEYGSFGGPIGGGALRGFRHAKIGNSNPEALYVGSAGRELEIFAAPLRLLPGFWAYDAATLTLFTSDVFGEVWRDTPAGPWHTVAGDPAPSSTHTWDVLVSGRYWWLSGARTTTLREQLANIFERYDVESIAPAFGCVIRGRDRVRAELESLMAALEFAEHQPQDGIAVGREARVLT